MSVEVLERAIASTEKVLQNVTAEQLDGPTPCASWTVRDLLNHLIGGGHWFAATVNTGTAPSPDGDTDFTTGDLVAAFRDAGQQAVDAFRAPGALEKELQLPWGPMPAGAFLMLAANDTFTHGWDLAKATGQSTDLDPDLADQLMGFAQAAIAPAFRGPDGKAPFGQMAEAPDGAAAADRLAAFLGREV